MTVNVVLDSGVILALLDSHDPLHEAARRELADRLGRTVRVVVPATVVAEVLGVAERENPYARRTVKAFIDDLVAEVRPLDLQLAHTAGRYLARDPKPSLAAAVLIATGEAINATAILTTHALGELHPAIHVLTQSPEPAT